jgi:hypothetical protein
LSIQNGSIIEKSVDVIISQLVQPEIIPKEIAKKKEKKNASKKKRIELGMRRRKAMLKLGRAGAGAFDRRCVFVYF